MSQELYLFISIVAQMDTKAISDGLDLTIPLKKLSIPTPNYS